MARTYIYEEPETDRVEVTEEEILTSYYPYWCDQMRKVGKLLLVTPESCIEDWCVVHWAWLKEE